MYCIVYFRLKGRGIKLRKLFLSMRPYWLTVIIIIRFTNNTCVYYFATYRFNIDFESEIESV